jgi:hypothetical protein
MVATAGKKLTENELRIASQCLQKQFYGGKFVYPPSVEAVKYTLEKLSAHRIKKGDDNLDFWRIKYATEIISKTTKHLPDDPLDSSEIRQVLHNLREVNKFLPETLYTCIWPPDRVLINVSETPVELSISGIYRTTENKTLHILDFTPYTFKQEMLADPAVALKVLALRDMVATHYRGRPRAVLHLMGINGHNKIAYQRIEDKDITSEAIDRAVSIVKAIENKLHWPTIPCPDTECVFKRKCFGRK